MPPPANPASVRVVTLNIDGKDYSARADETIIEVCRENKIPIPSLCYLDGLSIWSGCRLCLVEMAGQSRLFAACSTQVAEGMTVSTNTERLQRYRRTIVELLFAERSHVCSVCVSNGHCELQFMAQKCGVDHVRAPLMCSLC
jgi:bidirectional [NiFe] hydrogenase diaphorase subunit